MQVNATAGVDARPLLLAGFTIRSWTFAIRTCMACLLALYAGFWLELDSASSAAVTVAILALPTRGQGLEKAAYRLLGTMMGVAASIAIAGAFSQTDGLLLAAFAIWIGICVYAAAMLDGNRAYAAALCCITVGLIAVEQIDSPLQVFPAGIARGAAISAGILALALVNDALAAPHYHLVLAARLEALHRRVVDLATSLSRGGLSPTLISANLLRDIAALRPEIAALVVESSSGTARSAAARSAMVDLVSELSFARAFAMLSTTAGHAEEPGDGPSELMALCRGWLRREIERKDAAVARNLAALRAGTHPAQARRAPLYRSRRIAFETAIRAAIHFLLIAAFFVATGWPSTELCLSLVAVIIGLSATTPDQRRFASIVVLAMPIACLLAGILKYLVFNGVSEFQLLAIGLAPVIIGLALLISLPSPAPSLLGRLILVFTLAIVAPTNPQSYDPEVFLVTCFFACLSSVLVFAAQLLLPPLSNDRRIRLLLGEARRELRRADRWKTRQLAPEEAAFRDAAWLGQIVTATGSSASSDRLILEGLHCFDRATIRRWCIDELDALAAPLAQAAHDGQTALDVQNGARIRAAAEALHRVAERTGITADPAIAALVLAGIACNQSRPATGSSGGVPP